MTYKSNEQEPILDTDKVYEEDIEAASAVAVDILGVMGKWDVAAALQNVRVIAQELGDFAIWYGDTSQKDIVELAGKLNMSLTYENVA